MTATERLVEVFSIALVVPAVVLSVMVLYHWAPKAVKLLFVPGRSATDWLVIGIAVSFSAFLCNSLYWGVHYLAVYVNNAELAEKTYHASAGVNILTRNGPYILAAICHLAAFHTYTAHPKRIAQAALTSFALFVAVFLLLWFI